MAKPKGSPKHGGRQKGSRNKRTVEALEAVAAICKREKCNPIEGLCRIANDTTVEPSVRASCFKELASYMFTKPRAPITVSGPDSKPLDVNISGDSVAMQALAKVWEGSLERVETKPSKK